jgi:hypothetical protein
MTDVFFVPRAPGHFTATRHTSGPWDPRLQHAGPPAALLARALEQVAPREDMLISRLTFEILHAVPVGDVEVAARVTRPGRSVDLLEASLSAGGREVMRGSAWRVGRAEAGTATPPPDLEATPALPAEAAMPEQLQSGYLRAVEWRMVRGGFLDPGPAAAWTRLRYPLVPDEEPTGLQRLLTVADSGNGLSSTLDWSKWWFINPELTVHLEREAHGEWILVDAATSISEGGAGLALSTLSDADGRVGRGAQTLLVGRR